MSKRLIRRRFNIKNPKERDLKKSEKGLSTIVATLLIILVTIVAVGIIWVVIRNVIQNGAEQISLGKITLDLKISQIRITSYTDVNVTVKRNSGRGEFSGIVFVAYDESNSEMIRKNVSLNELESRNFQVTLSVVNTSKIKKISIAPVFTLASGKQVVGDIKDEYIFNSKNSIIQVCVSDCPSGAQCGIDSCGKDCGAGCTNPNFPICSNYQCAAQTCIPNCPTGAQCGYDGCTGTCGTCPSLPNSISQCNAGYQCEIQSCIFGYDNCDLNTANGCEVNLQTNNTNCGSCGHSCLAGETCTAGVCLGCVPTTFSPSLNTFCGSQSVTTNCGVQTLSGTLTCTLPNTCGGLGIPNACGCTVSTFNPALNTFCGSQSVTTNCGVQTLSGTLTCTSPQTCGGSGIPNTCGCTATTFNPALNTFCGSQSVTTNCGSGTYTGILTCTLPNTCGGLGIPNACGCTVSSYNPLLNTFCGNKLINTNCGSGTYTGTLTCTSPQTCGGSGTPNTCGCTATTFNPALNTFCGSQSVTTNCGVQTLSGTLTCTLPNTCGGLGIPNACGCTVSSYNPLLNTFCGSQSVTTNCGTGTYTGTLSCTLPQTCGGSGTPNTCGCTATTFNPALNTFCGSQSVTTNCGVQTLSGTLTCTLPNTCGGLGIPNACGCTVSTFNPALNTFCGSQSVTTNCGTGTYTGTLTCTLPQTCVNNACVNTGGCTDTSIRQGFEGTFLPAGWKTGGNSSAFWTKSSAYTINGSSVAMSGSIADSSKTWINYSNTFSEDGYIWFYWNVSSESNYDYLCFCQDKECGKAGCRCVDYSGGGSSANGAGEADAAITSSSDNVWTYGFVNQSYTAGNHFFTWCYAKDFAMNAGQDRGIIDNITFFPKSSCMTCTPTTCLAQGKNCDTMSDGCGGTLNCGASCTSPQTCINNVCTSPSCTDGIQNQGETGLDCGGPCPACSGGNIYYVNYSGGNDAWAGTSSSTAWKTIAEINGRTFLPGDQILFARGETWRETLVVPSSGNAGNYITFGNYGSLSLKNPKILGSIQATTWTATGTANVWQSATSVPIDPYISPEQADIFFENASGVVWGNNKTYISNFANLVSEYDWTWNANKIYIYVPSGGNPNIKYTSVEVPQRESAFNLNSKQYLHFDGIDVFYARWSGYGYDVWHNSMLNLYGLIIENSDIGYIGAWEPSIESGRGTEIVYSDMIIRNNKIHDCGRRSISVNQQGNAYTTRNILIEKNELYNGFHTTGVDINVGASYTGSIENITIRNNFIYETSLSRPNDASNFIFIQNYVNGAATIGNVSIYNNIFKYVNGFGILAEGVINGNISVYNNVFYQQNPAASWAYYVDPQSGSRAMIKNNIFYGAGLSSPGSNLIADYNLYYSTSSTGPSATHNVLSVDPKFVNPLINDFHLQSTSPAINKGIAIQGITTDYEGSTYHNPPSIGAYEYAGTAPSGSTYFRTFYVSNSGSNSNNGTDQDHPWQTIATKINGNTSFRPGDTILFKKGDTWRETLTVPISGNSTNYITFGAYGSSSKKPKIIGSVNVTTWTLVPGYTNIWNASSIRVVYPYSLVHDDNDASKELFFEKSDGTVAWGINKAYTSTFSNLAAEYQWVWNSNYTYIYSTNNPNTWYSSVEIPQRDYGVNLNSKDYVEINGLGIFYGKVGIYGGDSQYAGHKNAIIRNCEIAYLGSKWLGDYNPGYGTQVVYNNMSIEYNTIHDTGRRGSAINNYGNLDITNITVQYNTFYNGHHTTGTDVSAGSSSYSGSLKNITIRNNLMYDIKDTTSADGDFSELNWVQGPHGGGSGRILGYYFYNNILMYTDMSALAFENVSESYVYNNVFYGHNTLKTANTFHISYTNACTNAFVRNNIFYTDLSFDTNGAGIAIYTGTGQTQVGIDADYNSYYRISNSVRIIQIGSTNYYMNSAFPTGWETHGLKGNPLFVDGLNGNFHLNSNSPVINKGVVDSRFPRTTDYDSNQIVGLPDMGAFEYQ